MRRLAAALVLLAAAGLRSVADGAAPARPGREVIVPPTEVRDTFFAYLVGILQGGLEADLDNEALREVLTEFRETIALPFDRISLVSHRPPGAEPGSLAITFDGPMDIPVPFALLWYHPGRIRSSTDVRFSEASVGSLSIEGPSFGPLYALRLVEGWVSIDIDEWLDLLLGSIADDLDVRILAIVRWRGTWRCLLGGTGREGRRIIAAFDFARNGIVFPVPRELIRLGLAVWNEQLP